MLPFLTMHNDCFCTVASDLANKERPYLIIHTCPRLFQSILLTKIAFVCFVRVLLFCSFTYDKTEMHQGFKMFTQSGSIIIMGLETK